MDRVLAEIHNIKVDANDPGDRATAADRHLDKKDLDLAVQTAKDLTVNSGGLLDRSHADGAKPADHGLFSSTPQAPKMKIDVVDPLHMPRPDSEQPLDERLKDVAFDDGSAQTAAARDLPDIPVAEAARSAMAAVVAAAPRILVPAAPEKAEVQRADIPAPKAETRTAVADADVRRVQVGSFRSLTAAKSAWQDMRGHHAALGGMKPEFEKVVTPAGQTLFRLKVGPVKSEAQARALCGQLDVRDSWCQRAG
ncbi:SPOR domain-containing protein [Asticcacaulis solisilvae]|uniref:SPOR domain-containing protein n=1 Tax=Asticcacaulis solisilvae TaxID=1217274 RepID=UPI003FD7A757